MVIFYDVTRRLLQERLDMVRSGVTPSSTDLRHFYYQCRNIFLRENPDFTEIDSKSKNPYSDWEIAVSYWCEKQCKEFNIDPSLRWRVREKLNIWAEGKAICEGESGKFLIDRETRERTAKDCSFILLCEKRTVSKELLERLKGEGYKINLVSTGGHSPSDVQEAVMQVAEELDEDDPTFYFLVLHDYDVDGVKIYFNLKDRYDGVIDVGVNPELINYLKSEGKFESRLVEEQRLNRGFQNWLKQKIEEDEGYTLEDFNYLQGEQTTEKRWVGKRIEIDAIHVEYGIEPFIKYILKKIEEECTVWDLSRIGVEDFYLLEPDNHYEEALHKLQHKVGQAYGKKLSELSKTLNTVLGIVKNTLVLSDEFAELESQYRRNWILDQWTVSEGGEKFSYKRTKLKGTSEAKEEFKSQMERRWKVDYEDELDEINERVTHYEGDVRKGKEDLKEQRDELQKELEDAKEGDPDLEDFEEKLEQIEWGEEELDEIEIPDEAEEIRLVIEALEERLEELEDDTNPNT